MSVELCQQVVHRCQEKITYLHREKSREATKSANEMKLANAASESAKRTKSALTMQSKIRSAQKHHEAAMRHEKKIADIEQKLAQAQGRLADALRQLAVAQDKQERQRKQQQEREAREHKQRMSAITGTLSHHDQLHQVALTAIEKLQQLPEHITVLFLAANPLGQQQLRLDEEVRAIGEMIRKSAHRDSVRLESRWAVRPMDVLQAINECQPHVVHFSGHGSDQDEIVFQDNNGRAKFVSKDAIVQTMAAVSGDIQLVFFNTCYSHGQAEAVVQHIPAAIGMNTSIGDDAARVFSAQFYSSIGFGLSIEQAFQQAKAALMLEAIPEELTPELFLTDGLNGSDLVLVKPAPK